MYSGSGGEGAALVKVSFKGATLRSCDVSGVTMRGVDVDGLDIDSHDLALGSLFVNGVDVVPLVEAELDRRLPGSRTGNAADYYRRVCAGGVGRRPDGMADHGGDDPGGPGGRARRGRVVVGPDAASPGLGDRRLAARWDPAGTATVPRDPPAAHRCRRDGLDGVRCSCNRRPTRRSSRCVPNDSSW